MKIAIAYADGVVASDLGVCQQFLIVTVENGQPTAKELVPGVTGSAEEAAAKFLVGEKQGDDTVLRMCREEDPDDPMACMHDCSKCAGCGPIKVDLDKLDLPEVK